MGVVVAGENLVDLADSDGLLLPLPGGSPYNVALGLGRLGVDTWYLGGLSTDAFGVRLAERLTADGVDLTLVHRSDAPTTLAVVHLDADGRASYGFYVAGTAAAALSADTLPTLPAGAALHVSLGAIGIDHDPAGHALVTLLHGARGQRLTSLDPNVRANVLAPDRAAYTNRLEAVVAGVDLVKVSDEDLLLLHPDASDPLAVARAWLATGPALIVVTRGPDGAVALSREGVEVAVPGEPVSVVDTVGAGDAFTAGLLAWLDEHDLLHRDALLAADDGELARALTYARRVAAITCTRAGAEPPRAAELGAG